jgi:predicted nucleic acid-binding protein
VKILVDADALVALAKADDVNHAKALKLACKIKNDLLYLSPFTVAEAATVFSYRFSHLAARIFLKLVRQRNFTELSLDLKSRRLADEIFLAQNTRKTSWFDCLNAALYQLNSLDAIFSFDRFYRRMGLKLL